MIYNHVGAVSCLCYNLDLVQYYNQMSIKAKLNAILKESGL